jgi:hypothetical protein
VSSVVSSTSMTATTPAGTAGTKSVVVTNPDTQTSNTNINLTHIMHDPNKIRPNNMLFLLIKRCSNASFSATM